MCVCECRVLCSPSLLAPRSRPRMARREVRVRSGIHTSRMPRSRACLQANATRKPPGVENAANACEPPGPRGASDDIITPTQPITKEGHGDLCFAPHDPIFYAGVLGRGWKETFDRSEPPTLLVTVGVNRYSHFFSRVMKNGPKTLHGRPQRQPWCTYLS